MIAISVMPLSPFGCLRFSVAVIVIVLILIFFIRDPVGVWRNVPRDVVWYPGNALTGLNLKVRVGIIRNVIVSALRRAQWGTGARPGSWPVQRDLVSESETDILEHRLFR